MFRFLKEFFGKIFKLIFVSVFFTVYVFGLYKYAFNYFETSYKHEIASGEINPSTYMEEVIGFAQADVGQCESAIKRRVNVPESLDLNWFSDSAWRKHENGRQTFMSSFSVKTPLGMEEKYKVNCLYAQDGNLMEITILPYNY
jgi:hypothetical protein